MEIDTRNRYQTEHLQEALDQLERSPGEAVEIRNPEAGDIIAILTKPGLGKVTTSSMPPRLGGMATPLGVYLTDGALNGGAGFLGLFLTGMIFGSLSLFSEVVSSLVSNCLANHHLTLNFGTANIWTNIWLSDIASWAPVLLIFVLLRLIPLSGIHAAEHQVVHCVEKGLPLDKEYVRSMPRVHPRCGTNFFVGLMLFFIVFVGTFKTAFIGSSSVESSATVGLIAALPVALLLWRRLGATLQQWFATRPATDNQIQGAIKAAKELLAKRDQQRHNSTRKISNRFLSMGLVQVMIGTATFYCIISLVAVVIPALKVYIEL